MDVNREKNRSLKIKWPAGFVFFCVFFALLFSCAAAEDSLDISLTWTDIGGNYLSSTAHRVEIDGYPDAWWVKVDGDALDRLVLHIANRDNPSMRFYPGEGSTLEGAADAGSYLDGAPWINIESTDEYTGAISLRLYVSTVTDDPVYEKDPGSSACINVTYRDETTYMEIMQGTRIECPQGASVPVTAADIPGYQLIGDRQVVVFADSTGNADPVEVAFIYRRTASAGETVFIGVKYLDESNGMRLLEDSVAECQTNDITTIPAATIPGYNPLNASIDVKTDPNGLTSPTEAVFYYRAETGAAVTVHYIDTSGNVLSPDTYVECAVNAQKIIRAVQINGYALEGESTAVVNVDANGAADMNEVTFVYRKIGPVDVAVRYLKKVTGQDIASPEVVSCPLGETTEITAREISGYVLSGDASAYVTVGLNGEVSAKEVSFYYNVLETPTVRVSYLFEDGGHAAADDDIPCPMNTTTPISARNFPGYAVVGESVQTVTVDENGNLQPDSIRFVYQRSSEPSVVVRYIDQNTGNDIREPESVICPINSSTAVQARTVSGYTLSGQAIRYVSVDAQGKASPEEVVFVYIQDSVPQVAWVQVVYRDIEGVQLYTATEPCDVGTTLTVAVDISQVPAEYELSDSLQKTIEVVSAETDEVTFWFRKRTVNTFTIPIYYKDSSGFDVASAGFAELVEGNNAISAQPMDLKPNYALEGDPVQYVVMDETGQLSQSEVIFYYYLTVTPTPAPTPTSVPYAVEADPFYARASKDGIYFRSSPGTASMNNVIRSVSSSEVIYVVGSLYNELGEKWYQVDINGTGGFISSNVIKAMDQNEVNEYFGFTPTPVPTEIPDGAAIERWGRVNAVKVAFRRSSSRSGSMIDRLDKNSMVWIYSSTTADGVQWYYIRYAGTDGYIMKEFVNMMNERESADYQLKVKTPMPTRTPDPTRMATTEVTMTPMPTPTPEVIITAEPTPAPTATPYYGYAVTKDQTLMYAAPGGSDDSVIAEINAGSPVLIMPHPYTDMVSWDYIELVGDASMNNTGYMLDSDLEYIAPDMVGMHLVSQQTTPEPTVIPTQIPQQKYGFARTVGDNVALRAYPDTNAQIYLILSKDTVVSVNGQEYTDGQVWDQVNQGSLWGYIRDDQLQMLTDSEVVIYLESLRTPTPLPEATPTAVAVNGSNLTSYGYVTSNKVNLRSGPSRSGESIRLLDKYAFAIVYRTEVNPEGETWYYISQSGTEGYISQEHFKVLSVDELSAFLTSDEYRNASNNTTQYTDVSAGNIQALEDYNRDVWQNPAVSVSYEPFVPVTKEPSVTASPYLTPTPSPRSTYGIGGFAGTPSASAEASELPVQAEEKERGSSALGILLIGASAVFLGGGIYIYLIHRKNERRRRAVREQQARQAAARMASRPRTTRAPGYTAPEQGNTRRVDAAPFMPPSGAPSSGFTENRSQAAGENQSRPDMTDFPSAPDMQGTLTYPASMGRSVLAEDDNDSWRRKTITASPAFSDQTVMDEKQYTRVVPSGSNTAYDEAQSGKPEDEAGKGIDQGNQPVRHRRSERHRGQTGKTGRTDEL